MWVARKCLEFTAISYYALQHGSVVCGLCCTVVGCVDDLVYTREAWALVEKYTALQVRLFVLAHAQMVLAWCQSLLAGRRKAASLAAADLEDPLPRCLPRRRNTSAIPMCGAAVLRLLPLIARAMFHGSSITPAGMLADVYKRQRLSRRES